MTITEPGTYELDEAVYHADPVPGGSLSSTGARKLLPPSCPAIYRYETDHGQLHKRVFDFGHAAHLEVLGVGPEIVPVEFKDWKTKKAQEERAAAYAAGKTPLLRHEVEQVKAMGDALRADPVCRALFNPEWGTAELSLFWIDAEYEVWRRARLDWFTTLNVSGRPTIVDYKSTGSVDPRAISKAVHNWGYHQQQPYYTDGVKALDLADDPAFVFVFQMKTPPYLVSIVQLDDDAVRIGIERNRAALERFRDCQKTGVWPSYTTGVTQISLPRYASYQWADEQDTTDDN